MREGRKRMTAINERIDSVLNSFEDASNKKIILVLFIITFTVAAPIIMGYEIHDNPDRESGSDINIFREPC